jgi:hypothetical protein
VDQGLQAEGCAVEAVEKGARSECCKATAENLNFARKNPKPKGPSSSSGHLGLDRQTNDNADQSASFGRIDRQSPVESS